MDNSTDFCEVDACSVDSGSSSVSTGGSKHSADKSEDLVDSLHNPKDVSKKQPAVYPGATVLASSSLPVNQLLTTVQNALCTAEDYSTSDYESTCSDSSYYFRHVTASPRVLSPDCQLVTLSTHKDTNEFEYDDSSDVSDAYKSDSEMALTSANKVSLSSSHFNKLKRCIKTTLDAPTGLSSLKSTCSPTLAGEFKRQESLLHHKTSSGGSRGESFRSWRKSTGDTNIGLTSLSKTITGDGNLLLVTDSSIRAANFGQIIPNTSTYNSRSSSPSFSFGANHKPIGANNTMMIPSNVSSSSNLSHSSTSPLKLRDQSPVEESSAPVLKGEESGQLKLGPAVNNDLSNRALGRSTSLPLSLHVATGYDSSGAQVSPCGVVAVTSSVIQPAGNTTPGSLGLPVINNSPSCDIRRTRCPSTSSRCSASSPRPPSRIDQIKIEEATGLERDTLVERDLTLSSSLTSSWEDLCLSESHPATGSSILSPVSWKRSHSAAFSPNTNAAAVYEQTPNLVNDPSLSVISNTCSSIPHPQVDNAVAHTGGCDSSAVSVMCTPPSSSAMEQSNVVMPLLSTTTTASSSNRGLSVSGVTSCGSRTVTEPISISCAPSFNPNVYPPLTCSPSPTRITKQCYSPSLQMPLNLNPTCASPTGRRVFIRSRSPVTTLRPSTLTLKRRPTTDLVLCSADHSSSSDHQCHSSGAFPIPCKRLNMSQSPPPPPLLPPTPPSFNPQSSSSNANPVVVSSQSLHMTATTTTLQNDDAVMMITTTATSPITPDSPFHSLATTSFVSPLICESTHRTTTPTPPMLTTSAAASPFSDHVQSFPSSTDSGSEMPFDDIEQTQQPR